MQLISPVFPRINISHNKNIIRIRDGLFGIRGGGGGGGWFLEVKKKYVTIKFFKNLLFISQYFSSTYI